MTEADQVTLCTRTSKTAARQRPCRHLWQIFFFIEWYNVAALRYIVHPAKSSQQAGCNTPLFSTNAALAIFVVLQIQSHYGYTEVCSTTKIIIMILSQYEMSLLQQLNQHSPLVHSWQKAAMALQKPVNAETRCQKAIVLLIIRLPE